MEFHKKYHISIGSNIGNRQKNIQDSIDLIHSRISSLHAIEHFGLGRYGDPIDYYGHIKAISNITKMLKKNGTLHFSAPIGKQRIEFNAHRVFSYEQIIEYFKELELIEFSLVDDDGYNTGLKINADPSLVSKNNYACGCFWFKKKAHDDVS